MHIPTLKPCPFCGGSPEVDKHYSDGDWITIKCKSCGAELTRMTSFGSGTAIDRASDAWNRRTSE